MHIAKNNKKISDIAFKDQVIATVTQIENMYWDLVKAYEEASVDEQSLAFAQQSLDNAKKELQLESIPAMDEMKAEAEVSKRDQDLTIAKTQLELQQSLIKNALTKSLDDPVLEAMPVVPTDTMPAADMQAEQPVADLIAEAMQGRPELAESDLDLVNRQISRKAARNALLPTLSLQAFYGGTGSGGCGQSLVRRAGHFDCADRFGRRDRECLQQLGSGLLCRAAAGASLAQSRSEG